MPLGGRRPCTRSIHWPDKIGKSREVLRCREPVRLEAPHLARRSRTALSRLAADDPAHRRIMAQALGVVHVLVSGKTTEHRLPQQTDQRMAAVLAGARIGERLARHRAQPECVVEFAIGQQSGIGGDHGAAKLQHQAAVEIEPESTVDSIHPSGSPSPPRSIQDKLLIAYI